MSTITKHMWSEKSAIIYLFTPLVLVMFALFATYYFFQGDYAYGWVMVILDVVNVINFILFKKHKDVNKAIYFFAFAGIPILLPWQINGGMSGTGIYWMYINMVGLFFMLGTTRGSIYVLSLLFSSVAIFLLQQLGYVQSYYSVSTMISFYFGYIIMLAILYGYQLAKDKAQSELDISTAKNDAILESVDDGLVAVDNLGNVVFANPAVHKLLGWRKDELLGKKWIDVVAMEEEGGEKVPAEKRPINLVLNKGEKVHTSYQYSYVCKGGNILSVAITISPIILGNKAIGAIEIFRDNTKERSIDHIKSEFISLASHQMRTPLSAMKWNLEMLLAGDAGTLTGEQKKMTQNIDESNERMISLVNSLLNVSKIDSGKININPQATNLGKLVQEVVSEMQQEITSRKQKLVISVDKNLPQIVIDQELVRQVYINLLTNAIKYTPSEGEIFVFISKKEGEILTQISDNGFGIPTKDKDKVFDKFYRGENVTKIVTDGNGLGMYLVKAIIGSSGGKVWFESYTAEEKGDHNIKQGTTVWFTLPKSGTVASV